MNAEQKTTELRALMLPLQESFLLLPQSAVADISFHYEKTRDRNSRPGWFHGDLYWHGSNVPVISYEKLNGKNYNTDTYKEKIAICNLLDSSENYPAVGLLVKAVPRMVQIQRGALLADNTERLAQFALAQVVFQGERMSIPDLDGIAKLLDKSL
jgi:chemosensory pili system protein ChpC